MKAKPAVKNELFLENALTLGLEDEGATLRAVVLNLNMLELTVHKPPHREYEYVQILLSPDQMEELVTLWNEWKDEKDAEAN